MSIRIFPILGSALNFGGRRMETIAALAWLPIALLLLMNMATVFAYLWVIAGQPISFAEAQSLTRAEQWLSQYASRGWENNPNAMWAITGVNLVLQTVLIASFMAPLIRLAGLGEKPASRFVNLPFGADQLRFILSGAFSFIFVALFILAPIITASIYSLKYIFDAVSMTMASFPNPESLHTIEIISRGDSLAAQGLGWVYGLAAPLAFVLPFAFLFWLVIFLHFHPRNRPNRVERSNPALRALVTVPVALLLAGGGYWLLSEPVLEFVKSIAVLGGVEIDFSAGPDKRVLLIAVIAFLLAAYFNIRLYPYPGIAVCRKSLAPAGVMRLSRGWNFIRLIVLLFLLWVFLSAVQYAINKWALVWIVSTLNTLYQAVASSTRLLNSGEAAQWVLPFFVWIWQGIKIIANILLTFFNYGVIAGLYGRLYRESIK